LSANFGGSLEGSTPTRYKITRMIALSCGIKISAFRFVTKHACDKQTDRITITKNAQA